MYGPKKKKKIQSMVNVTNLLKFDYWPRNRSLGLNNNNNKISLFLTCSQVCFVFLDLTVYVVYVNYQQARGTKFPFTSYWAVEQELLREHILLVLNVKLILQLSMFKRLCFILLFGLLSVISLYFSAVALIAQESQACIVQSSVFPGI